MRKFEQLSSFQINRELNRIDPDEIYENAHVPIIESMDELVRSRDNWLMQCMQYAEGMEYYRGLLDQVAQYLGPEVFIADDGSVHDSPLRAKIPELVEALRRQQ